LLRWGCQTIAEVRCRAANPLLRWVHRWAGRSVVAESVGQWVQLFRGWVCVCVCMCVCHFPDRWVVDCVRDGVYTFV